MVVHCLFEYIYKLPLKSNAGIVVFFDVLTLRTIYLILKRLFQVEIKFSVRICFFLFFEPYFSYAIYLVLSDQLFFFCFFCIPRYLKFSVPGDCNFLVYCVILYINIYIYIYININSTHAKVLFQHGCSAWVFFCKSAVCFQNKFA